MDSALRGNPVSLNYSSPLGTLCRGKLSPFCGGSLSVSLINVSRVITVGADAIFRGVSKEAVRFMVEV